LRCSDPAAATIYLGYGHYAEISIVAVLMGWVHLPRELRGQAPVRTHPSVVAALFVAVSAPKPSS
jgi:hypothetical protein